MASVTRWPCESGAWKGEPKMERILCVVGVGERYMSELKSRSMSSKHRSACSASNPPTCGGGGPDLGVPGGEASSSIGPADGMVSGLRGGGPRARMASLRVRIVTSGELGFNTSNGSVTHASLGTSSKRPGGRTRLRSPRTSLPSAPTCANPPTDALSRCLFGAPLISPSSSRWCFVPPKSSPSLLAVCSPELWWEHTFERMSIPRSAGCDLFLDDESAPACSDCSWHVSSCCGEMFCFALSKIFLEKARDASDTQFTAESRLRSNCFSSPSWIS
mmetsp:Transcript_24735/g.49404  ORF Transcript_24735/g.49404 Transcript_24735/m.49404 type:complete len:275 (+) Transcript_24735:155-979(+)